MRQLHRFVWLLAAVMVLSHYSGPSYAAELIITNPKKSSLDKRFEYPIEVLKLALERTREKYGAVNVQPYPQPLSRKRALIELVSGNITVFSTPTRREWEEKAIPVRIPIRKGLMGYRLFLIREESQKIFSSIKSIEELKKLSVGQGLQWSTTAELKKVGFTIDGSTDYESLFNMLMHNRFDYFPRAITEIFTELDLRKDKFPDMRIEETLSLYLPLPYYFFVSPKHPDLAKRIETGLHMMIQDGSMDLLFNNYHRQNIDRANLDNRRILKIKNLDLPPETPFDRKEFWYQPEQ